MRVTLLGPVAAEVDGAAVALGGRRQRAAFALLALDVGRVVSLDHLVRVLWEDDPPAQATMALQSLISRLRRGLALVDHDGGGPRILTRPPGWLLELDADAVDAVRFKAGVAQARRLLSDHQPSAAAVVLREALRLWSGPDELEIAAFAPVEAVELEESRRDASELLFAADLASGSTQLVLEGARRFVTDNPFRERAWMSLSLALYRSGRQADALAAIAELRTALADGLGLDPSPEVSALERQILLHDEALYPAPRSVVDRQAAAGAASASPGTAERRSTPEDPAAPAIVGRGEVFAVLDEVLAQASRGRGRVVVVEGVAGIGKSTVLHAVDARAAVRGGVTIHGAGATESPAFWPWVTAVRELVAHVPGLVDRSSTSALATIDPALFPATDPLGAGGGDPALGRTRLSRAVIDLVGAARRTGPVTVVIDDVQAIDGETAGLLAVAMPELTAQAVLFVLGLRKDEGADEDVTGRLLERVRRDAVVRIALADLTRDEVAETIGALAQTDPDPAVADAVWARSGGNPLFVTELVRLLVSEDRLEPSSVYAALPAEVRDVLRRRLDRLPDTTVSLLVVVALLGRATDVSLLGRVTDRDEDDVVDACEIAVLAGLLVDDPRAPGCYTLSHDLVRQTLAETVAPARRVRLHARIVRALDEASTSGSDHVVELARHALLAAPVLGASTALPFLVAAADDALSRLALSQAEQHLHDVLTLAGQLTSADERARVERSTRSRLAMTHVYAKGPASLGEDALIAAGVLGGSPLTLDRADPTAWFAAMTAALAVGAYRRMVAEAVRALAPDLPPTLEAMVRFELGLGHFELGHLSAARTELEATRRLVSEGGDFGSLIFALSGPAPQLLLGVIAHFDGDEQRADAMLAEAASMTGDSLATVVELFGSAWLAAYRGDAAGAAAHARTCAEVSTDYPAYVAMSGMIAGWADALLGDPDGVVRADEAFADYTSDGTLLHVPMFLVLLAEAHELTGDVDGARARVSQARSVAGTTGEDCLGPRLGRLAVELAGAVARG